MAAAAEEPAPPPPRAEAPPTPPEKRAQEGQGQEERPEPKRRRACIAALEKVPRAAAVAAAAAAAAAETVSEGDGVGESAEGCDGGSFSFHARSFSGMETTPKFGSFNPATAEFVAFHLEPLPPRVDEASAAAEAEADGVVADCDEEAAEGKDGNSH